MALTEERLRGLLAWLVIVLLAVPVGGALWLGVAHGESPCILCWTQRTSMVLIALVALFVVRYGPRPRYLGVLVLLGAWGTFMALRHSGLHLARDVGQGFSGSILGAHTYTWSWVIHWLVLLAAGVLLLLLRGPLAAKWGAEPGRVGRFAMGLLVVMAGANAVQAFVSTGPPPYIGQSDPVRLSLDPRQWVWSMDALNGPVSWRGSWTIPQPDPAAADPDPANGPLAALPVLPIQAWERITASLDGTLTGLAVARGHAASDDTASGNPVSGSLASGNPASDDTASDDPASANTASGNPGEAARGGGQGRALAVTDRFGVYVLDSTYSRVLHRAVLDRGFSIDLSPLAGAAFLNGDTIAVMSTNKSYVLLRGDSAADAAREWRHFLDSDGAMTELRRSRFATVRARQMYARALAYDAEADELVTLSVPSPRHQRLVVSRFDRADFMLSSEFLPRLGPGLEPSSPGRGLAEYVVTGAVVVDGLLYAISAAYSTLLVIDLQSRSVTAAYAVPGITNPVGLAARGAHLLVAQADGRIAVLERPAGHAGGGAVAERPSARAGGEGQ
jgi:disulfide bond formation protein DsbB